jgi:hypothetical protein
MKKLIAISVVFALAAGAVFAVDLGGGVIGTVNFLEGSTAKDGNDEAYPLSAGGSMNRFRLEGSGENDDGTFGGWIRAEGADASFFGNAWWKPIDQFKLMIGSNGGDGFYGKEGVTGWGFYQTASDTGVVNAGNAWGGGYGPVVFRSAFYGGFGTNALHLTISPVEIVDINIAVPFWDGIAYNKDSNPGGKASSIFKRTVAQLDFKLDFGNIALTYVGAGNTLKITELEWDEDFDPSDPTSYPDPADDPDFDIADPNTWPGIKKPGYDADAPTIFAYFGLTAVENLGIDFGIGFPLPVKNEDTPDVTVTRSNPLAVGLGVKFATDAFGIKARVVASFAGSTKVDVNNGPDPLNDPFKLTFDILPFYNVSDTLRIFFSAGIGMTGASEENKDWVGMTQGFMGAKADAVTAWHINPYVEVGAEWGPKFLAGLQIWSDGAKTVDSKGKEAPAIVKWAVPLALHVGF